MTDFARGARVAHAQLGSGTFVGKLPDGKARVRFDFARDLPLSVPRDQLAPLDSEQAASKAPAAAAAPPPSAPALGRLKLSAAPLVLRELAPLRLESADAWQTLEALRLGVVPARGVEAYTVGRPAELKSLGQLLDARRGSRIVWGDYGAGKTHLIEIAEQLALERGFAVARVTLDPRQHALQHPLRLYRALARALRLPGTSQDGLEGLMLRLVESPEHYRPSGRRASRFFSPYLHALRRGDPDLVGWLRDYAHGDHMDADDVNSLLARAGWPGQRVLTLSDYRTYGRMYVHMIGTLAAWCEDAGLGGLVLLFDEVERVDALGRIDRMLAFEVLKHFAAVTMERDDLAFDPEALYKGGQEVHKRIGLRFDDSQPLAAVFALTPLPEVEQRLSEVTRSSAYDVRLGGLDTLASAELVQRVAALYERAHAGWSAAPELLAEVHGRVRAALDGGHDSLRAMVRAIVFLFDGARLGEVRGARRETEERVG